MTIGLKSVENPLEFGIVVTDEDGRIERFLEKPSWGQVFSDTINTGIYVLEPEVLKHVPTDRPYDFSKELFPLLLEMGRPLYGKVCDGYWQDIGNLDQYRQANFDALDGQVDARTSPGCACAATSGSARASRSTTSRTSRGRRSSATTAGSRRRRRSARTRCSPPASRLRERARTVRSVIDASTHVGRSALVEGAIVGRSCDIRSHVRIQEGAAIGDEVVARRAEPGAPRRPDLPVQGGRVRRAHPREPDLGVARDLGAVRQGRCHRPDRRRPDPGCRRPARRRARHRAEARRAGRRQPRGAAGVPHDQAGDDHRPELGRASTSPTCASCPPAVSRHMMKTQGYDAGSTSASARATPSASRSASSSSPGIQMTPRLEKEVAKHFNRREFRRVPFGTSATSPTRRASARSTPRTCSRRSTSRRSAAANFRIVVDYGYSASSFVLPLVLGPLHLEAVSAHGFTTESAATAASLRESIGQAKRLVIAIGAELGAVFDRAGERLFVVDEQGREIAAEQTLLLFLRLIGEAGWTGKVAVPVTVTSAVEEIAEPFGLEVVRTPAAPAELTKAAIADDIVFAGAAGGVYVFPKFLPAYDAVASLCTLLELLARVERPVSELVAELPRLARRPPPDRLPVGAEGPRHAGARRAAEGPRARPDRRDQGPRRARLGRGAARPRRAARPRLRGGASAEEPRPSSRPSCTRSSTRRCRGRNRPSGRKSQAEVEPLPGACFNGGAGRRLDRRDVMEALPDLASLSDSELKSLIKRAGGGGERDLLPAAPAARQARHPARGAGRAAPEEGGGELGQVDLDRLTDILAGKAAPPRPGRSR